MEKEAEHIRFMKEALKEAEMALRKDEVPIGAVVVCNGKIIARAHNLSETLIDPTAHAEMQAITSAASFIGGKYLTTCTLYVTVEPCVMCAGALYWSQVGELVYGADDPKKGFSQVSKSLLHPKTKIVKGILAEEASIMMTSFFRKKR